MIMTNDGATRRCSCQVTTNNDLQKQRSNSRVAEALRRKSHKVAMMITAQDEGLVSQSAKFLVQKRNCSRTTISSAKTARNARNQCLKDARFGSHKNMRTILGK